MGITALPRYCEAVRPDRCIGSFGLVGCPLVPFPLASPTGSQVPYESPDKSHAAYKPDLTQSPPNYRTCSAHKKKPGRLATRAESERKENCFNEPCAAWAPAKVSRRAHPQTCRSLRERYARE